MRRFVVIVSLIAAVLLGTVSPHLQLPVLAQDATPTGEFVTPDPVECQMEPRTLESVVALVATPVAGTPVVVTPATGAPSGEPADTETVAAVTALARESVACLNAGEFLRQLAFYTDNGLRGIVAGEELSAEDVAAFLGAPPQPFPVEFRESVRVRDVRVLSDGRVTAYLDFRNPEGTFTTFATLIQEGDQYLIDSDVQVGMELATPTP